ncbi:hypothetical protein [Myxococcus fulvus]|uniref:hypothetical protein n=1 Tax=Myxococcus fulvus TaxID=33 RepID=UPI0020BF7D90|nr:hypothetical protein [Myxococcus fulvus]MCK8497953.1 hypothetical protein [Myxococcus fulvus]
MRGERWWRGVSVFVWVALLVSGCASLPANPGPTDVLAFGAFSASGQVMRGAGASPEEEVASSEDVPLHLRREPLSDGSEGAGATGSKSVTRVVCGGTALPVGWPELAPSREVVESFLGCGSPGEFVAMQRGVDMAALVESLTDWDAVRLGALGPMDARASGVLGRKRAAFLVTAVEKYGVPYAEVLALFVLHSAFDDELREVVRRLSRDKQLGETLGSMPVVREELKQRGLALEGFPERGEQGRDVLRGLGRAGRDMLSSSLVSGEARYTELMAMRGQMPPRYQEVLDDVQKELMQRHYAPGSVAAGAFDSLTFGVPMGFYHLVVGTGHGARSLAQGRYEQATMELAPAALVVALYAGSKGARALVESRPGGLRRVSAPDVEALKAIVKEMEEQFGSAVVGEFVSLFRGRREVALFAAVEGPAGVIALHEARGNLPKAQAMLAERYRESARASATSGGRTPGGGTPSLPPEAAGLRAEVAEAKLKPAEAEAAGGRLPVEVRLLERHREALLKATPRGAEVNARWPEYLSYLERRTAELETGVAQKGPLEWAGYLAMRDRYARGLAFEKTMVAILEADAALPRGQRRWLKDFDQPRIETHVGVMKADLRFADVLVIEERPPPGQSPRVETFSFKSRELSQLKDKALQAQMITDASAALTYYGETLSILRPHIRQQAKVLRVRLVYEGGPLKPSNFDAMRESVRITERKVKGVEVSFE